MATATVRVVDVNVFLCSCESIQCVTTTAAAIIICFVDFSSLIAAMLFAGIEIQTPSNWFFLIQKWTQSYSTMWKSQNLLQFYFWFNRIFRTNTSRAMLLRAQLGLIWIRCLASQAYLRKATSLCTTTTLPAKCSYGRCHPLTCDDACSIDALTQFVRGTIIVLRARRTDSGRQYANQTPLPLRSHSFMLLFGAMEEVD